VTHGDLSAEAREQIQISSGLKEKVDVAERDAARQLGYYGVRRGPSPLHRIVVDTSIDRVRMRRPATAPGQMASLQAASRAVRERCGDPDRIGARAQYA